MTRRAAELCAALCALLMACGGNSGSQSPSGGPPLHKLTVAVNGAGSVTSTPAGIACGTSCSASFAQGAAVVLSAIPVSGYSFSGWSGACSGSGSCSLTMAADTAVTAQFTVGLPPPPPPPPLGQKYLLTVSVQGQGSVKSTPAGIDCGAACSMSADSGSQVQLTPAAATGWQFASWTAECKPVPSAVGNHDCYLDMSKDQTATAVFTAVPPPPPPPPPPTDDCAGLMPPSPLPASINAAMPQGGCIAGSTSDDGIGTFALGYEAGPGPTYPDYQFFQIQNGQAVRVGDNVMGSDEGALFMFSQPSGFTVFRENGNANASSLTSYSHDGVLTKTMTVEPGMLSHPPSAAIGVDPSGGTAVAKHNQSEMGSGNTWFLRLDKNGDVQAGQTLIDGGETGDYPVVNVGVALSGHALVVTAAAGAGQWRARWMNRDATPLTGWFTFQGDGTRYPALKFLMDGSLAIGFGYPAVHWSGRIADGATAVNPAPAWLAQRADGIFAAVRGGKAYAAWGNRGLCGAGFEVLTNSGKSCGCATVPGATGFGAQDMMSFGRDGSLMLPDNSHGCTWQLYPQLMK